MYRADKQQRSEYFTVASVMVNIRAADHFIHDIIFYNGRYRVMSTYTVVLTCVIQTVYSTIYHV
jgi:DNA polymerase I-like protein with 3'-5' exonuclease and polymerase domains